MSKTLENIFEGFSKTKYKIEKSEHMEFNFHLGKKKLVLH